MNKNNAGFWAFLGVAAAIVIGAFFLAPNFLKNNAETASDSTPKSNMVDATAPAEDAPAGNQGLPVDGAGTESAPAAGSEPAEVADGWIIPSFDILRVEPDGSTVIAGKAEPGTTLDIMNGDAVIASTQVGPSGDFAVILDTPLSAGDYQLTLRITGEDGEMRQSEEVATVSIPESAGGELLAMVSKPGKASRIIAQPMAPAGQAADTAPVAAATPDTDGASTNTEPTDQEATDVATAPAEQVSGDETASAQPVADAAGDTQSDASGTAQSDAAAGQAAEVAVAGASERTETPALPDAASLLTTSAPEIAGAQNMPATGDSATSSDGQPAAEEVAMASPEASADAAQPDLPAGTTVRVDAVEIEGDRIFIAGSATPGYTVQVSADGVVIGSDKVDETGRFIVEAISELSVGDHIISADLMDASGSDVLLRATVPFNRPEGEALAAVAPAEPVADAPVATEADPVDETPAATQEADAAGTGELILPDIASLSKMREDAFQALSDLKNMVSAADAPEPGRVAEALDQAVAKLKSAASADLPEGSGSDAMAIARSMRIQAESALAVLVPNAGGGANAGAAGAMIDTGDLSAMSEILTRAETVLAEPADMSVAADAATEQVAEAAVQTGEPKTILQAPLASTPGAVIIRRGDTLWQISRRTYGEGVRYTTIYVANRSQIQDPNRIKPGQVFSVPENPLDNAEEMHKQLLDGNKNL
jgi:nucleoid-associated protein YgaU